MASYCSHLYDYGSNSYCDVDQHKVSSYEWKNYCSYNYGKGCGKNYFIATETISILNKDEKDPVYENIKSLRDNYLEKDRNYSDMLGLYDLIGPAVASKMDEDKNREVIATKVYSLLSRISTLVSKEEIAKATRYYNQMVGVLVKKYDLGKFYEETNKKIKLANNVVKKHKIRQKTLD